jgi:hypothetical protein
LVDTHTPLTISKNKDMDGRGRSNSFQRNTQRRLSMRRRQQREPGNNERETRINQLADNITKVKLPNVSQTPASNWVQGPPEEVSKATRMVVGSNQFIHFQDQGGRKIYADIDYGGDTDVGELVAAAIQRSTRTSEGIIDVPEGGVINDPDGAVTHIILKRPPEGQEDQLLQQVREVVGDGVEIRLEVQMIGGGEIANRRPPVALQVPLFGVERRPFQEAAPQSPRTSAALTFTGVDNRFTFEGKLGIDKEDGPNRKKLIKALTEFHKTTRAYRDALKPNYNGPPLNILHQRLVQAKAKLDQSTQNFIARSTTNRKNRLRQERKTQRLDPNYKDPKLQVVRELQAQIRAVDVDGFKEAAQYHRLLNSYVLLVDGDKDTSQRPLILGQGSGALVTASTFKTNGRNDLPLSFTAAVKPNSNQATEPAQGAKIPPTNPQEAERSVATYLTSRATKLNNVPITVFYAKEGKDIGYAQEVVNGTDGQIEVEISVEESVRISPVVEREIQDEINRLQEAGKDVPTREAIIQRKIGETRAKIQFIADDLNSEEPNYTAEGIRGMGYKTRTLANGTIEVFPFTTKMVNLPLRTDPVIQKGLSDLQLLDVIVGHADRNPGNIKFVLSDGDPPRIIAVVGIDNDDALGYAWEAVTAQNPKISKTPGLPPLVDFRSALGVLETRLQNLQSAQGLLSDQDATALGRRLQETQDALVAKLFRREFASNTPLTQEDITRLASLVDLSPIEVRNLVGEAQIWGSQAIYDAHVVQNTDGSLSEDSRYNSYLGTMALEGQNEGTIAPKFKTLP